MHLRLFAVAMSLVCEVMRMSSGAAQKQSGEYDGIAALDLEGSRGSEMAGCSIRQLSFNPALASQWLETVVRPRPRPRPRAIPRPRRLAPLEFRPTSGSDLNYALVWVLDVSRQR